MRKLVFRWMLPLLLVVGFAGRVSAAPSSQATRLPDGPWGELYADPIYLTPPPWMVQRIDHMSNRGWRFKGVTLAGLDYELKQVGFRDEARAALLEGHSRPDADTLLLLPSYEQVRNLNPAIRGRLNLLLLRHDSWNYKSPLVIPGGDVRVFLAGTDVPEDIIQRVENLSFLRGRTRVVADRFALFEGLEAEARHHTHRALLRTRAQQVWIRLTAESNLEELSDWWSGNGRNPHAERMLHHFAPAHGEERFVDIINLLPPVPRSNVYTYEERIQGHTGHDCYWTSANFFVENPLERFVDDIQLHELGDYLDIPRPGKLGDIILLMKQDGTFVHACVYLAPGLVFTKNGSSSLNPWMLMTLDDLMTRYQMDRNLTAIYLRLVEPNNSEL